MFRTLAAALILIISLAPLGGCEDKINESSFSSIKPGMAVYEAEKILGGKGELETSEGMSISGAGIASGSSSTVATYVWKKNGKQISVQVEKGKITSVSKAGF